jgi:hypothetical protein
MSRLIFSILTGVCLAASVAAAQPGTLADIAVKSSDGASVTLAKVLPEAEWLVLYVQPPSTLSDSLLVLVDRTAALRELHARIIVVVRSTAPEELAPIRRRYKHLGSAATWLADPQNSVEAALSLAITPVTIAGNGADLVWVTSGVPEDAERYRERVGEWLARNAPSPRPSQRSR